MKKLRPSALALLPLLFFASATGAEAAEASMSWASDGALSLIATISAPNGCYQMGPTTTKTPEAVPAIENTVAVTFTLNKIGDLCAQEIKDLTYNVIIPDISDQAVAVVVYEDWPEGQPLKAAAYALPPRAGQQK